MYRFIILFCIVPIWTLSPKIVPFKDLGPRIINGQKASKGQFPWQVAIYVKLPTTTTLCGGALISDQWILTAGHCVQDAVNFTIALGSNQLSGDDPDRVVFTTAKYIQHEKYNPYNLANDIALIPLSEAVDFDDNIQAIRLTSSEVETGTSVTVSGWGLTKDSSTSASNDLNYVGLETISNNDCKDAYGMYNDGVVCANGVNDVVQSTCEGDSGGPLVINNNGVPSHVGVVSYGHPDGCESGKPAGFTRTYYFKDWIKEKTGL